MSKKTKRMMRELWLQTEADNYEVGNFGQIWRTNCTDCGSANLRWEESPDLVALVKPEVRLRVQEGIENGYDGRGWVCLACGCFGLFPKQFER